MPISKNKLGDVAKDLNMQTKDLTDLFTQLTGDAKKVTSEVSDTEMNTLFEHLTNENTVASFDEYFATQPKPEAEKPAEKPAQKQPEKAAQPKPQAQQPQQPQPQANQHSDKKAPAQPRKERIRAIKPERKISPKRRSARLSQSPSTPAQRTSTSINSTKNIQTSPLQSLSIHAAKTCRQATSRSLATATITAVRSRSRKSARQSLSVCSAFSLKKPARRSSRCQSPTKSPSASLQAA